MARTWFYAEANRPVGPVPEAELRARLEDGRTDPDCLVWTSGMDGWEPAWTLHVLAEPMEEEVEPDPAPAPDFRAPKRLVEQAILICLLRYARFSGRASRSEFWYFNLFAAFMVVVAALVDDMAETRGLILTGTALALVVPVLAVGWRRFHDVGWSGRIYGLTLVAAGFVFVAEWVARDPDLLFAGLVELLLIPLGLMMLVGLVRPGMAEANRWG